MPKIMSISIGKSHARAIAVLLAPMSGVSDEPFREIAACHAVPGSSSRRWLQAASLVESASDMVRRAEGAAACFPFAIQLAGREAVLDGGGCAHRAGSRRRHHRHQYGLPGAPGDRRPFGLGLMRDLDHALTSDRGHGRSGARAGHAQDAARLGCELAQCAGACAPRRGGRRADGHGPWPHALPVLWRQGRLAGHCRGQARRSSIPLIANGDVHERRGCARDACRSRAPMAS